MDEPYTCVDASGAFCLAGLLCRLMVEAKTACCLLLLLRDCTGSWDAAEPEEAVIDAATNAAGTDGAERDAASATRRDGEEEDDEEPDCCCCCCLLLAAAGCAARGA